MVKKPPRWFFSVSLSLGVAAFLVASSVIFPFYSPQMPPYTDFLASDYDTFYKYAVPLGLVLSASCVVTIMWGLLVYRRGALYLLVGAPLALILPWFLTVLIYSCARGACF